MMKIEEGHVQRLENLFPEDAPHHQQEGISKHRKHPGCLLAVERHDSRTLMPGVMLHT